MLRFATESLPPSPRELVRSKLRARRRTPEPPLDALTLLGWPLHGGQQAAWDSPARFVAVIAGTQSGKTSFGPLWLDREIRRRGAGDYLVATATYDLFKLKLLPECLRYFVQALGAYEYQATDRMLVKRDGRTRIILRSATAEGGLESATVLAAWLDECGQREFGLQAWEAVQRRLSINEGRCLLTTTPYNLGWLKQQVADRAQGGDADYEVVRFRSTENPAFPASEFERMREILPDWKFAMFYCGEFERPGGLIYGDYADSYRDHGGHLVRAFTIPDHWLRYFGADLGPVNCARVWAAEEPGTDNYYIYREALGGGKSGPEMAAEALAYREPVKQWVGGSRSEDEARRQWQSGGVGLIQSEIHDVEAGIDHVTSLFKQRRLFVFDTCTGLRSELGTYSRELDGAGEPTARIADKQRYHLADALRYLASILPEEARDQLGLLQPEHPHERLETPETRSGLYY